MKQPLANRHMQNVGNSADSFILVNAETLPSDIEMYFAGHTSEHMHIKRIIVVCSAVIYRMISDNKCPQISTRGVSLIGNTADIGSEDITFYLHKS